MAEKEGKKQGISIRKGIPGAFCIYMLIGKDARKL
jgi:hypothetical protein